MRLPLLLLAALLIGPLALTGCSGASDLADRARDAVEEAMADDGSDATYPEAGVLVLVNDTSEDLCNLHISDFDEPDVEGYDLIEAPLAPGDSLSFPYGSHPDTDEHNLVATPSSCDGTEYAGYHFSYHNGGARYSPSDANAAE